MSLCCGEADKLRASKCESCSDEGGTETLESIVESAWMVPVFSANITSLWSIAANDEYNPKNSGVFCQISLSKEKEILQVSNDRDNLDDGEEKLCLSIPFDSKEIDGDD